MKIPGHLDIRSPPGTGKSAGLPLGLPERFFAGKQQRRRKPTALYVV